MASMRSIGHPRKHAIQSNLVVLGPLVVFRFPHSPIPPCPVGFKIALPLSNSAGVFWVYMPNPPPMSSAYLVSHLFLVGDLPQVLIADYHTGHLIPRIKRRHLLTNTCSPANYLLAHPPGLSTTSSNGFDVTIEKS